MISRSLAALALAFGASAMAADPGRLLVCNKGEHSLGVIDVERGRQVAVIPEDAVTGHEVVASPDGRFAFVPIYGNSGVGKPGTDGRILRVIDLTGDNVVNTIDFGKGVRPHCAVIGPKNGHLYITTELDDSITEIDPETLKIIGRIPTGAEQSHMLCIRSDGRRGYTANVKPGTVSVLDLKERKVVKIIPVSPVTQRICISPDDRHVFTADQTQPRMAVIDTRKDAVVSWIDLPGKAYGAAVTPDGRWLVAALPAEKQVAVIDLHTMSLAKTIPVPPSPQEVLIRPDGGQIYVSCDRSHEIAVIDPASWGLLRLINAGAGADGLAWAK